jgi:hypothetical protein
LEISGTKNIVENLKLPIDYTERGKQTIQDIRNNLVDIFGTNQYLATYPLDYISKQLELSVTARNYLEMRTRVNDLISYISPSYSNREEIIESLKEIVSGYGSISLSVLRNTRKCSRL